MNSTESWKPSLFLNDVLKELLNIIDHPNLNLAVNEGLVYVKRIPKYIVFLLDVANEYLYRKDEYDRKALAMVQQHKISRM